MGKIYIKSITDLNEYLGKQPEIKTAIEKLNKRYPKNSRPKKIKSADGVTKDLAFAMGVDKRVAELVKVTRRVVECRSDAKKILTRHVKSGKRRIDHESGFTKKMGHY